MIDDVRLVGDDDIRLTGAKLAPPDRGFASVQYDGSFPPTFQAFNEVDLVDAEGATITPVAEAQAGWELLLGIEASGADQLVRDGVEIDYRVGDRAYTTYFPAELAICTSRDQEVAGDCPFAED